MAIGLSAFGSGRKALTQWVITIHDTNTSKSSVCRFPLAAKEALYEYCLTPGEVEGYKNVQQTDLIRLARSNQ